MKRRRGSQNDEDTLVTKTVEAEHKAPLSITPANLRTYNEEPELAVTTLPQDDAPTPMFNCAKMLHDNLEQIKLNLKEKQEEY